MIALLGVISVRSEARPLYFAEEPQVSNLFEWLSARSSSEAMRLVFIKPRILTWETGIPAMGLFMTPGSEWRTELKCGDSATRTYLQQLKQNEITHVVVGDYGLAEILDELLRKVIAGCDSRFWLEFQNDSFAVYGFLETPG